MKIMETSVAPEVEEPTEDEEPAKVDEPISVATTTDPTPPTVIPTDVDRLPNSITVIALQRQWYEEFVQWHAEKQKKDAEGGAINNPTSSYFAKL
jgi:hypothetical protein